MGKYIIGDYQFKNQLDLKSFTKNILNKYVNQIILQGEEYQFLMALFERHPEWESKRGTGITHIKITPNMGSYHIDLFRNDNTEVEISWNTCIRGRGRTEHGNKMRTYREEIEPQIKNFRSQSFRIMRCELCNAGFNSAPHVDHSPSFSSIVRDYESSETDDTFYDYHARVARFMLLCAPCNFKKGISDAII